MGKNKRQRLAGASHKSQISKGARQPSDRSSAKLKAASKVAAKPQHQQHSTPTIPFLPSHRILLVGEGDLSFAASLVTSHGCRNVTATVLEKDLAELEEKYPHVRTNIEIVEGHGAADQDVAFQEIQEFEEDSAGCGNDASVTGAFQGRVVFGVQAGKMGPWLDVEAKKAGRGKIGSMDRIVFNFPHVGGKSTDVNRQVRYNQELLVSFFKRAPLSLAPGGSIIVTLFEGEPYSLWNIRDLARHSGLQVERSFKFQASAYPGYHHARTLGAIKSKTGEASAGWKGEDRLARSYIFVRKGDMSTVTDMSSKRKRGDSPDEEED
ncbi:MAG: hypothetical protein M1818_000039 [Claussenomyces sp. TS43310]|nr:MAG: hypothetical protein M1818_000039 [Claussenomyces sp. TS43310]